MQIMAEQTALKKFRTELYPKVSQEDMARASNVTYVTYRRVENGGNTTYSTAQSVLRALNGFRKLNHPRLEPIAETEIPSLFKLV